jgi:hypothetical protein
MTTTYPPAEWLGNGNSGGDIDFTYPNRIVLHTTETSTLPSYSGGNTAPHLTYDPKARKWYQHTDLEASARALYNKDGGVQTNRAGHCLQVEIICYSAQSTASAGDGWVWVGALEEEALADLADFCRWGGERFDIEMDWPHKTAFSYGEANAPGYRMSESEWRAWNAVCRHQDVTENEHWDTGALDLGRIIELAEEEPVTPEDKQDIADMTTDQVVAKLRADGVKLTRSSYNAATIFSGVWGRVPGGAPVLHSMRWMVQKIYGATVANPPTPQASSATVDDVGMAEEFEANQGVE